MPLGCRTCAEKAWAAWCHQNDNRAHCTETHLMAVRARGSEVCKYWFRHTTSWGRLACPYYGETRGPVATSWFMEQSRWTAEVEVHPDSNRSVRTAASKPVECLIGL